MIEERGELRVAASSGQETVRLRIVPVQGSALGELYRQGKPVSLDRPRGQEAAWLHELGLEARAALVEPLSMEGYGGGLVIALRRDGGFRGPDREALNAFATSVAQRLAAERSVEIKRLRYGMEARERERTRWAREIHDETIQGLGALRMRLANARDQDEQAAMSAAVEAVLEGLGEEIDGLRHLITELRPAALDDLGLAAALQALARRAQAIDGLGRADRDRARPRAGATPPGRGAREHDLSRRAGGADEREPPRQASTRDDQHRRARRGGARVGYRRRAGTSGSGPARAARRRPGGRVRDVGDARARRARRRRAGARPGAGKGTVMRLTVPLAGRPDRRVSCPARHRARPSARRSTRRDRRRGALLDQAEAPRVGRDLRARGEAELLDRPRAVGLDGALGHVQLLGDLRVGEAVGDQPHDLALAL